MFGDLTQAQAAAVAHGDGPLLVFAGAGSGKTRTLAAGASATSSNEVSRPSGSACSRSAAGPPPRCWAASGRRPRGCGEARSTPSPTACCAATAGSWASTRRSPSPTRATPSISSASSGPTSASPPSRRQGGRRFPSADTLAAIASRVVNAQEPLADVVARRFPWCRDEVDGVRDCLVAYTQRKRDQRVLDLDDLLLFWQALARSAEGAATTAASFDHVLVDEYQDTNALQADILDALRPGGAGLTVVGDDAQAIYGFRAATPRNILDFPVRYPEATVVRLTDNHRSTPPIVAVANAVMAGAAPGHWSGTTVRAVRQGARRPVLRTCADEAAQATEVCDSVLRHRDDGIDLHHQAVLFRASWHADLLELELGRRNVPYVKYGGLKFLEAAHVKDLLALLRLLDNPWDELAWSRALRLLDGVGPVTARRLTAELGVRGPARRRCAHAAGAAAGGGAGVPAVGARERRRLARRPRRLRRPRSGPGPAGRAAARLPHADRRPAVRQPRRPAGRPRPGRGGGAAVPRRTALLTDLVLDPPQATGDLAGPTHLDDDWLTLSTVHSAKGGEWDVVHVIHAADGCFPSDLATGSVEELEEERRLFYVACTRARNVLEISWPLRYHHNRQHPTDRHGWAQMSRLVSPAVQALVDAVEVGPAVPDDAPLAGVAVAAVDDRLSALWG